MVKRAWVMVGAVLGLLAAVWLRAAWLPLQLNPPQHNNPVDPYNPNNLDRLYATVTAQAGGGEGSGAPTPTATVTPGGPIIETVAGGGDPETGIGDGGPATSALLNEPMSVAVDAAGNLYIADTQDFRVREVLETDGEIQTVAGDGTSGISGDGGPAVDAELQEPVGLAVDASGNLYIADVYANRVREVVKASGDIQTVAGDGAAGFSGDGGPAVDAELQEPEGLAVDSSGNLYIDDSGNNRIREVVEATGDIQTVAGDGTQGFSGDGGPAVDAELNLMIYVEGTAVAVDTAGNLYIADAGNECIRKVVAATGNIETVVGDRGTGYSGDGGPALNATLSDPAGVVVDASGNLYISDSGNFRVREVVEASGDIQTVAGDGTEGFSGDGGPAVDAELSYTTGDAVDASGDLFISDAQNNRIREVLKVASPALKRRNP